MPRPRAFDEDTALAAATNAFWQHGYAATSVRDLGAAMGLGPASLYNAFGDKQSLFARCLDRYLDQGLHERLARLESEMPPRAAIAAFLGDILARALADPRGCLLVNSALEVSPQEVGPQEMGPQEVGPGATLARWIAELEGFFLRTLRAGQHDGSIAPQRPAEDLARLLLTTVMGLRVLGRAGADAETLRGTLRAALSLLDPPLLDSPETPP